MPGVDLNTDQVLEIIREKYEAQGKLRVNVWLLSSTVAKRGEDAQIEVNVVWDEPTDK